MNVAFYVVLSNILSLQISTQIKAIHNWKSQFEYWIGLWIPGTDGISQAYPT